MSPQPCHHSRVQSAVRAHERRSLDERLRDQHAVERVAMEEWKRHDSSGMRKADVEQLDAIDLRHLGDQDHIGLVQKVCQY